MADVTVYTPSGGAFKIRKAKGTFDGLRKKIAISFDEKLFNEIAAEATEQGNSFSKQVLLYVQMARHVRSG